MARNNTLSITPQYRQSVIVVPEFWQEFLNKTMALPVPRYELPEPHTFTSKGLYSYRRHARAHHRIELSPLTPDEQRLPWKEIMVRIPRDNSNFPAYLSTWQKLGRDYRITNHYDPEKKLTRWQNKKMQDWKPDGYNARDTSQRNALNSLNYRSPFYRLGLVKALEFDDPGLVADTAIVLSNLMRISR